MANRRVDYLYRRGATWWLKLQPPDRKMIRRSLGTTDRLQAEVLAGPLINEHKRLLLEASRRRQNLYTVSEIELEHPLGERWLDDGTRVRADNLLVHFTAPDGRTWTEANGQILRLVTRAVKPGCLANPYAFLDPAQPELEKTVQTQDPDLQILETYLGKQPRPVHYVRDARRSWAKFKAFVGDKPLSKCTRADGHAFVKHLRSQDPAPAPVTIRKWLSHLKAPIADGLSKNNPAQDIFHRVIGNVQVQTKRLPLSDADMALFRCKVLPHLGSEERLMWLMLATTGMRPSEVAAITEEFDEFGLRYIMIGVRKSGKTATSARRIPIPDALLPHLPARITGPLFTKNHVIVTKNLLRALRRIGIIDERKVVYSLRHRAHDRLRAARCPYDIQLQIVGHDEATVHMNYGKGESVAVLKSWIERIGH